MAYLANTALLCNTTVLPHSLYSMEEYIVRKATPTLHMELAGLTRDPYLRQANVNPAAHVEVFVDDFLEISQGYAHR